MGTGGEAAARTRGGKEETLAVPLASAQYSRHVAIKVCISPHYL